MCTMDKVTHVLCLQGWERAHNLDNYMAPGRGGLRPGLT